VVTSIKFLLIHFLPCMNNSHKKGFSFIEMLIAVAIIGMALPALFSIIFVVLQQETKVLRLSEVKRQGDYVLTVMDTVLRNNAVGIYTDQALTTARCANAGDTENISGSNGNFYFKDKNSNYFRFYFTPDKISSGSATTTGDLTTSKVMIQNFKLTCKKSAAFSPAIVGISFDICYKTSGGCSSTRVEETATMSYQTSVKLRNQ